MHERGKTCNRYWPPVFIHALISTQHTKTSFQRLTNKWRDVTLELFEAFVWLCVRTCVCKFCYMHWDTDVSRTEILSMRGICPHVEKLLGLVLPCCCFYCFHGTILLVHAPLMQGQIPSSTEQSGHYHQATIHGKESRAILAWQWSDELTRTQVLTLHYSTYTHLSNHWCNPYDCSFVLFVNENMCVTESSNQCSIGFHDLTINSNSSSRSVALRKVLMMSRETFINETERAIWTLSYSQMSI